MLDYAKLNCGRITDSKEVELSNKYNRTFVAQTNGDCINGNCATCMYCRSISQRCDDLHGYSYCTVSKKNS